MTTRTSEQEAKGRFAEAGIRLGSDADADIIMTPAAYPLFLKGGMGIGRSFQEGLCREGRMSIKDFTVARIKARMLDPPVRLSVEAQSIENATRVAREHYDLGNDYFAAILDPLMQYSTGYDGWGARTNPLMQLDKLELLRKKLNPSGGETLLDIGSGFGGLLKFMYQRSGMHGTGATLSGRQYTYSKKSNQGTPNRFLLQDYRHLNGQYDRIVSVGMFEHVGTEYYGEFFAKCKELLKPGGCMVLHSIFGLLQGGADPWKERYIFAGGELPVRKEVEHAIQGRFVAMDWHKIGRSYVPTLMAWNANLRTAWPSLRHSGYSEETLRTQYYDQQESAARFETGIITVHQVHLFHEPREGYRPVR